DRLVRRLACRDMSADEVPTVGIPLARGMTMHQPHETVSNKRCHRNSESGRLAARYARRALSRIHRRSAPAHHPHLRRDDATTLPVAKEDVQGRYKKCSV